MPKTAAFKTSLRTHAARATGHRRSGIEFVPRARGTDRARANDEVSSKTATLPDPARDLVTPGAPRHSLNDLPDRGPLLCPKSVALIIFPDVTRRQLPGKMKWVRENVPFKLPLGHKTPRWFEADVRWWLEEKRGESDGSTKEGEG